jgi:PHP family Zn ribbon phosphoesterase
VGIDVADPIGSFTEIVQNVIERLTEKYGTEVTITLDVAATRRDGFDAHTVRTVRENAQTLGLRAAEFDEE